MQELGCFHLPELCTNPCNMVPNIVMLQHEAMPMDEWHDKWLQDTVTVSLYI